MEHRVVSQQDWVEARRLLLAKEKAFTHARDALSAERRELPWVKVEKSYVFDGPHGKCTLADLFDGRSQLLVYHFMFGPDWEQGCPSCSYMADHFDGQRQHLVQRDLNLVAVARAPIAKIEAFRKRMGWRFPFVSSFGSDFNRDFDVSFDKAGPGTEVYYNYGMTEFPADEAPGVSAFYKNEAGEIFHTYSAYARGLDILVGAYNWLDIAPKGRDEDELEWPMAWVRHHDRYESRSQSHCCQAA